LSDLISFGVAPGILAFLWALEPFGRLGWLAAFMYVICGALRLARFNVQKDVVKSNYFKGLPIPAAASFVASAVLFASALTGVSKIEPIAVIVMMYVLSFLMVSTVNYFSFKEFDIRHKKPFNVLVSIILVLVLVAYKPKIILFFILLSYVLSGPLVTLYRRSAKRSKVRSSGFDGPVARNDEDTAGVNEQELTG
jgi:CDP-diacylglycerol--serine O-phosphatidyltransferase